MLACLERFTSISVRLLRKLCGFFNFVFELVPFFKPYIRPWYNQLKIHKFAHIRFSRAVRDFLLCSAGSGPWQGVLLSTYLVSFSDQSSDILQHSQNRPTEDRWLKL